MLQFGLLARKALFGGSIGIGIIAIAVAIVIVSNFNFENENTQNNTIQDNSEDTSPLTALINYRAIGESRQQDGLAIVDINPNSETYGDILQDVPIGAGVLMHHPFYNYDGSKLYNTSLGGVGLYRINLHENSIFDVTLIDTGSCVVGEDMYFDKNGEKFYLTCMGSDEVIIFDGQTDKQIGKISMEKEENSEVFVRYPHGISADEKIDRMIFTETVAPSLDDFGSTVTVVEYSTGEILSTVELLQDKDLPSAPVEVQFHPTQHVAYVSGMHDSTLWTMSWNDATESFDTMLVDDGKTRGHAMPLAISFGPGENLYVSFANPGVVNEYSLEDPKKPELLRTLPADAGAHHVLFSSDNQYMFVQNNLLNLDGINSGTISVVDFQTGELVDTIDALVENGMMIESFDLVFHNSINQKVTLADNNT